MKVRNPGTILRSLFVAGLVAAAVLSLLPHQRLPDVGVWDKWQHLAAYAALAFTGCGGAATRRAFWVTFVGVIAYGGALEIAQTFVPDRLGSLADMAANMAGVMLGAILARLVYFLRDPGRT